MSADRVTRYELRDASGVLVAIHTRIDEPEGTKRFLWRVPECQSCTGLAHHDLAVADMPLYGIDRLDAKASRVVIVEGEKAADALIAAGIPAVGTVTGSSAVPGPAALAELAGRHVVLWPDNDVVGSKHMAAVAKALRPNIGTLAILRWPEAPKGGDAADYLAAAENPASVWDLIDAAEPEGPRETFERHGLGWQGRYEDLGVTLLVNRLTSSRGEVHGELSVTHDEAGPLLLTRLNLTSATTRRSVAKDLGQLHRPINEQAWREVLESFCRKALIAERTPEPLIIIGNGQPAEDHVPMLLDPLLEEGEATIIFGEGGTGKSYLAALIAICVATGRDPLRGWHVEHPVPVLVLDWESRPKRWNDRVFWLSAGLELEKSPPVAYRRMYASLSQELETVAKDVADHQAGLLIIDSVGSATPTSHEGADANETAIRLFQALRPLNVTTLLIDHVSKSELEKAGKRNPYGSVFKTNIARNTYEFRRDNEPDDNGVAHLALFHAKANDGAKQPGVGLRMTYGQGVVTFAREDIEGTLVSCGSAWERVKAVLLSHRGQPMFPKEIADEAELNQDTCRKACQRHAKSGDLVVFEDGRYGLAYKAASEAA